MRKECAIALILAALLPEVGVAAGTDLPDDKRVVMLHYDEADVYNITTRYGYQTNIVFSTQEEIETISLGDRSTWQIIPAGNRMFIRPMEEDSATNMTVITNRHSYLFDLKSLPSGKRTGNIYVAKFLYNDDKPRAVVTKETVTTTTTVSATPAPIPAPTSVETGSPALFVPAPFVYGPSVPAETAQKAPVDASMPADAPVNKANYKYTYAGSDSLAPLQVYDDGTLTYIHFDTVKSGLDIHSVNADGSEHPLTYTKQGNIVVVEGVTGHMVLKHQDAIVHIFNEILNPQS